MQHQLHIGQPVGLRRVVITADRVFLLQDETTRVQPYGTKNDPCRRHVLKTDARAETGMAAVSLAALGYDAGSGPGYLLFREDTAVFATNNSTATFVHGDSSLAERVIPVMAATRARNPGDSLVAYKIEAEPLPDVLGLRQVRLRVQADNAALGMLDFTAEVTMDL